MSERIQKALASAGVASRREIEEWIREGRILVNGRPAEIGQKITHDDRVRVDGRPVRLARKAEPTRVLLFRKRVGEMVTRDDPEGRRTVFRKLPELESGRWIAVGRLDINTSGLLLLTNDGELARRLTHPSFEITREYAARVLGEIDEAMLARLRSGVTLDDGPAKFESIERGVNEEGEKANQWYDVVVREGRNRLVRRLFESQGLQVSRLIRIAYGPVQLGRGIKSGGCREATPAELAALLRAVGMQPAAPERASRARGAERGERAERPHPASRTGRAERAQRAGRSEHAERAGDAPRAGHAGRPPPRDAARQRTKPAPASRGERPQRDARGDRARPQQGPRTAGRDGRPQRPSGARRPR